MPERIRAVSQKTRAAHVTDMADLTRRGRTRDLARHEAAQRLPTSRRRSSVARNVADIWAMEMMCCSAFEGATRCVAYVATVGVGPLT
jgi:hypothetical protein